MNVEQAQVPGTAAKKATVFSQACCKGMGGGVWLGLLEICAAFTDIDQE